MARTNKQLKAALVEARQTRNAADRALKDLADLQTPTGARGAKRRLGARLRKIRRRQIERIPILRDRLKAKRENNRKEAVAWVKKQVGTTESPPGSNTGPHPISKCQEYVIGYDGVPYCGCFVGFASSKIGKVVIPLLARIAYCPYIVQDAINGVNGLEDVPVSNAIPGDWIVFNFGSGIAKHVGFCVGRTKDGEVVCVEANTSSGSSGSQDDGEGIWWRERVVSHVICVARPDYA